MEIDYQLGFFESLYLSKFASILFTSFAFYKIIKNGRVTALSNKSIIFKLITFIIGIILVFFCTSILVFISAFSIINLWQNLSPVENLWQFPFSYQIIKNFYEIIKNFVEKEINNGVIQLRVTSLIVTFQIIYTTLRLGYSSKRLQKFNILSTNFFSKYPELENLQEVESIINILTSQYLQYAFYTSILSVLWTLNITENTSFWSSVASFCAFFIIDDWSIIADYEVSLKGRRIKAHSLKILSFNLILFALCTLSLFTTTRSYAYSFSFILIVSLILVCRYNYQINIFIKEFKKKR